MTAPDTDHAATREARGRKVREAWVNYCLETGDTKPSHIAPWEELSEWDKEADRRIGDAVATVLQAERDEAREALEAELAAAQNEMVTAQEDRDDYFLKWERARRELAAEWERVERLQTYALCIREELLTRYPEYADVENRVVQSAYLQPGDLPSDESEAQS